MSDAEAVAVAALEAVLDHARPVDGGLEWPGAPSGSEADPTLYQGAAGIVFALVEGYHHTGDQRYGDAAERAADRLAATVDQVESVGLYAGLTGTAVALAAAGRSPAAALDRVRASRDDWGEPAELMRGYAGIALGALACGAPDLAELAVEPYLRTAQPTPHGVQWEVGWLVAGRLHHISHGTLGIVAALATVAETTGRADLLELAMAGAADVVARNAAGTDGFLVPHSDPPYKADRNPRWAYGWCHGPAGDAQVFRLLGRVTGDASWTQLGDRCWHTITTSGLPKRLRPGFWDNNGRCCGTAGVLALASDRIVERGDDPAFAETLVADLVARADHGMWSNHEHRADPPDLEPRLGWAMGSAGIARELLRYTRLRTGGDPDYAVAWPDQPRVGRP